VSQTNQQYQAQLARCRDLFLAKSRDYGTSWTILRLPSLTDQIMIKAERIRSIQESGVNKVGEGLESEFIGIVNYCVIALMRLHMNEQESPEAGMALIASAESLAGFYDQKSGWAFEVMEQKNHDYGEAWRKMRISSIMDLILMKIARLKQIEDNEGKTEVSEGVAANYIDMLNYALFCLIKMSEKS